MELLIKHLKVLGLSEEEIQIYLTSLEKNSDTVLELAQNTGIPRTTVYLLVDSLLEKGLLRETIDGKKKKYKPASPSELVLLAKKKEEEFSKTAKQLEATLPQIHALYNREHGKPTISVKKGKQGVKEVFENALQADTIYMQFTSSTGRSIMNDIGEDFYEKCLEKMIATRQIILNSAKNVEFKATYGNSRNQIVLIDQRYAAEVDYMIFNNKVVYMTYKEDNPFVICIEDMQIAYFEKVRYNILFDSLREVKEEKDNKVDQK